MLNRILLWLLENALTLRGCVNGSTPSGSYEEKNKASFAGTVLLTFWIMYHNVLIVITGRKIYTEFKVQSVPSFIFMLRSPGMHLHFVQLLFCVLHGCVDFVWYMSEREWVRQKWHTFHNAALHNWKCTMDDNHTDTFFLRADTTSLLPLPSVLQHPHGLQPILWMHTSCRPAHISSKASFFSSWPKPRSNKNQHIDLGWAVLSLRQSWIHSPASLMLTVPQHIYTYVPFRLGIL